MRLYPSEDSSSADPNGFVLEGANNGGSNYTLIASGTLTPQIARNMKGAPVNPTLSYAQEIRFTNTSAFSRYRLTFPTVSDTNQAPFLSLGGIELLGVAVPLGISQISLNGTMLTLQGSGGGNGIGFTVLSTTNLAVPLANWTTNATGACDANGNFSVTITNDLSQPWRFYQIRIP